MFSRSSFFSFFAGLCGTTLAPGAGAGGAGTAAGGAKGLAACTGADDREAAAAFEKATPVAAVLVGIGGGLSSKFGFGCSTTRLVTATCGPDRGFIAARGGASLAWGVSLAVLLPAVLPAAPDRVGAGPQKSTGGVPLGVGAGEPPELEERAAEF